jgi:hypothetical protein
MTMPSAILQSILQNGSSKTSEQLEKELFDLVQLEIQIQKDTHQKINADDIAKLEKRNLAQIAQSNLSKQQKFLMVQQFNTALIKVLTKMGLISLLNKAASLKFKLTKLRGRLIHLRRRRRRIREEKEFAAQIENIEMIERKHAREHDEERELKKKLEDQKKYHDEFYHRWAILPPAVLAENFASNIFDLHDSLADSLKEHNIDIPRMSKAHQDTFQKNIFEIETLLVKQGPKNGPHAKQLKAKMNHVANMTEHMYTSAKKCIDPTDHKAHAVLESWRTKVENRFTQWAETGNVEKYDPKSKDEIKKEWANIMAGTIELAPPTQEKGNSFLPSFKSRQAISKLTDKPNVPTEEQGLTNPFNPRTIPKPKQ